jgi:hypothetical protein
MGVRGWPWWRLLIKITPMLNVHRTENQLKTQTVSLKNVLNVKKFAIELYYKLPFEKVFLFKVVSF